VGVSTIGKDGAEGDETIEGDIIRGHSVPYLALKRK
jgi:hypothetical protein